MGFPTSPLSGATRIQTCSQLISRGILFYTKVPFQIYMCFQITEQSQSLVSLSPLKGEMSSLVEDRGVKSYIIHYSSFIIHYSLNKSKRRYEVSLYRQSLSCTDSFIFYVSSPDRHYFFCKKSNQKNFALPCGAIT